MSLLPVATPMRFAALPLIALLAACGDPQDRLTDEEASVAQSPAANADIGNEIPADSQEPAPRSTLPADGGPILYRAVGNEPGWSLTIRPGRMDYQGNYGEVKIAEPTPPGFRPGPGRFTSGRLTFGISDGPCSDGMSDLVYRHNVRISADGESFTGCGGGTMAPDSLAGTSWTVTAINGQPTGGGQRFFLQFEGGRVSGALGCNRLHGTFGQNGDHVFIRSVGLTRMACEPELMAFENEGLRVLTSNIRVELTGGTRARLVSEAGTIDLARAI